MIVGIVGARVGAVIAVRPHPRGKLLSLAQVVIDTDPFQIVFGGTLSLTGEELVAVALPGSRAIVETADGETKLKKMRVRRYRGERSHGMLCSLDELGWVRGGPNEVAVLCDLIPGDSLDELPDHRRPEVAINWERAKQMEKQLHATTLGCSLTCRQRFIGHQW